MRKVEDEMSPEFDFNPKSVAVVSTSFYPKYGMGGAELDNVRASVMIDMAQAVQDRGYRMVVVDGGSPTRFTNKLKDLGVTVLLEDATGMAASRRQVINAGSALGGIKIIAWSEEKPSVFRDNDPSVLFGPLIRNEADIVIPDRGEDGRSTYLPQQRNWEERGNSSLHRILMHYGLVRADSQQLDMWSGPRIFRNEPGIIEIFNRIYTYERVSPEDIYTKRVDGVSQTHKRKVDKAQKIQASINPERWSNSIFLPIINALWNGYRVASVPIQYVHSKEMNTSEMNNLTMEDKRVTQYVDIIHSSIHLIHQLRANPFSRIHQVSN
jgi:hypothetical protein